MHEVDLPLKGGGTFDWHVVNPFGVLNFYAKHSPGFCAALKATLGRHPSSPRTPWRVIYYADEACPSSMLTALPSRKAWSIYWSFEEFGPEYLCREAFWFLGGVLRLDNVKLLEGGGRRRHSEGTCSVFGMRAKICFSMELPFTFRKLNHSCCLPLSARLWPTTTPSGLCGH